MARPIKTGLSYFPLDAWLFEDRKIQRLIKQFKSEGIAVYMAVLCDIYKGYGYYIPYNDDYCFDLSFVLHLSEESIQNVILYCVEIKLFDFDLFHLKQMLSSSEIQKQYTEICRRRKNSMHETLKIMPELSVADPEPGVSVTKNRVSAAITPVSVTETPVFATITPIKEKKENKKRNVSIHNSFYEWVTGYFNTLFCNKLTMVKKLTDKRRQAIKTCVTVHGEPAVKQMLDNAFDSPFLLGENNRGWRADFDWLFNPNNFIKVIEGTYLKQKDYAQNKQTDSTSATRKEAILRMAADATSADRDTHPLR